MNQELGKLQSLRVDRSGPVIFPSWCQVPRSEESLKAVSKEVSATNRQIVLFIDDIHTVAGSDSQKSDISIQSQKSASGSQI